MYGLAYRLFGHVINNHLKLLTSVKRTMATKIVTGLVEDALSGLLNDSRHKGKKLPEAFEEGIGDAPINATVEKKIGQKFKLSHGKTWIRSPITGKCLTIDPIDHFNVFELSHYKGEYCSIKYIGGGSFNNTYVFAGDQASVKVSDKTRVGEYEQFCIRTFFINDIEFCYICCKRDQEHWYVDEMGKVRHRNRKEEGFMLQVFRLHRV